MITNFAKPVQRRRFPENCPDPGDQALESNRNGFPSPPLSPAIIEPMLILAHLGITAGTLIGIEGVLSRIRSGGTKRSMSAGAARFLRRLDYRLVLLGSMLPDIIDKPLGIYLFPDTFGSGRIFAHTLLFLLALGAIGTWRYRRYAAVGVLTLALGTFMHLVLDGIWRSPETLFWPAYGMDFPEYETRDFFRETIERLLHKPSAYISEFAGLAIGIGISVRMLKGGRLLRFLRTGALYD